MSVSSNIESMVATHEFFHNLDEAYLAEIAKHATPVSFNAGDVIFRAGETAEFCYLIREGHVAVGVHDTARGARTVQTVGAPSVLGWSWLVPPYMWCFDARAVSHTQAIAINAEALRQACEEDHELGFELLKRFTEIFAERLHAARFQLLDVYNEPV
jgi:CRP-like cAMP-binding protein